MLRVPLGPQQQPLQAGEARPRSKDLERGAVAAQLAQAGVKRISIGGALSRLALASVLRAAQEMKEQGGFTWIADTVSAKELKRLFHAS